MPKISYLYQTEDDITVGLIHSIIVSASALKGRDLKTPRAQEALRQLVMDGTIREAANAAQDAFWKPFVDLVENSTDPEEED